MPVPHFSRPLGYPVLPREFFAQPAAEVARAVVGKLLVHAPKGGPVTAGRIVEAEAYLGLPDRAAHAWRGRTPRTEVLFGPPGHAYVYFVYGMHHCLNFVAEPIDNPGCVLIRALEPLAGLEAMRVRSGRCPDKDFCRGPGRLTRAMGIDKSLYGADLVRGPLTVRDLGEQPEIEVTPRIGINHAVDWPLRFVAAGSSYVSCG